MIDFCFFCQCLKKLSIKNITKPNQHILVALNGIVYFKYSHSYFKTISNQTIPMAIVFFLCMIYQNVLFKIYFFC